MDRARTAGRGHCWLAGAAWLAGDVWSALVYAHRGPLVHALLTYPSGRTRCADRGRDRARVPRRAGPRGGPFALGHDRADGSRRGRQRGDGGALAPNGAARMVPLACSAAVAAPLVLAAIGRLAGAETDVVATVAYEAAIV